MDGIVAKGMRSEANTTFKMTLQATRGASAHRTGEIAEARCGGRAAIRGTVVERLNVELDALVLVAFACSRGSDR